jgi:hypothetical protein
MRTGNDFIVNSRKLCLFVLSLCVSESRQAYAQAAAEMAGANSVAAVGLTQPNSHPIPAAVHPNLSPSSTVVSASTAPALNRRNLEQRAGRNAGKLLLRSVPSGGQTWIDGVFVGRTPLLLILAPGKYRVEIHGPRQKFASSIVDLQPSEIRDVDMPLMVRYPTNIVVR